MVGLTIIILGFILYIVIKNWLDRLEKTRTEQEWREFHEQRRREWKETIEPKLRDVKGYPEDWILRRREVFLRANGHCESCGKKLGRLAGETASPGISLTDSLIKDAHVHHIKKVSEGGDHSLSNLQLLCEPCHALKHPDRAILGMISRSQQAHKARRRKRRHYTTKNG